jgi:hypothetical protein
MIELLDRSYNSSKELKVYQMYSPKISSACWLVANGYECNNPSCDYSHEISDVCFMRQNMEVSLCYHGIRCKTRCNKMHNPSNMFEDTNREYKKRKRCMVELEDAIVEKEKYTKRLANFDKIKSLELEKANEKLVEFDKMKLELEKANEKLVEFAIEKNKKSIDTEVVKLQYALMRSRRELNAVKQVHREVLTKTYIDDNIHHIKEMNSRYAKLFHKFRLNFYNYRNSNITDDPANAISIVNNFIHEMNDAVQFRNKTIDYS